MRGGQLRHVVTLQIPVESKDALGDVSITWLTLGDFRANVRQLSGRELIAARQITATGTDIVTLRHQGMSYPITPQHRLLFRGRTLGITHVNDVDNRLRQYDLLCEEIKA